MLDLLLDFYLLQESHMVVYPIFVFFKMNFVFEYQLFEVLCDFIVHLNMLFFFLQGFLKACSQMQLGISTSKEI